MDITLNIFCKDHCKCHLIIKMYFYQFFFTLNLVQCSCIVSSKLVSSSSIILWKKTYRIHLKKNKYYLGISEAPPPGQKLLSPYDSLLCTVQFWLHKYSSVPNRFEFI